MEGDVVYEALLRTDDITADQFINKLTPVSPNAHDSLHTNNQHNYKSQNSAPPLVLW